MTGDWDHEERPFPMLGRVAALASKVPRLTAWETWARRGEARQGGSGEIGDH